MTITAPHHVDALDVARIDLVAEQSRLGGLERWLADPTVDEVLVNAGSEVWIDRGGALSLVAAPAMYRVIGMSGIFIFIAVLAAVGQLSRRGVLPRTRPIVPGEWAVSD